MKHQYIFSTVLTILLSAQQSVALYKVHEWGTFTSLVGSNGQTQAGMYHEDEKLPDFVYEFGEIQAKPDPLPAPTPRPVPPRREMPRDRMCKGFPCEALAQANITQKMETPVIYFYSDSSRTVDVNVKFPKGVISETYPAPIATSPTDARGPLLNGDTTFRVDVIGPDNHLGDYILPKVDPSNIYAHARKVSGANLIQTNKDYEKFIFYRGIGQFQPSLTITSKNGGLNVRDPQPHSGDTVYLVHVDQFGHANLYPVRMPFTGLLHLDAEELKSIMVHPSKNKTFSGEAASAVLIEALVNQGLYQDEAVAMIKTWEHGYLKVPGLRLLYILDRDEVEDFLPLKLSPPPEEIQRVFVGRIEVMLDTEEVQLYRQIRIERGAFDPSSQGRFAEARLRRIKQVYLNRCAEKVSGICDTELGQIIDSLIRKVSSFPRGSTVIQ